MKVEVSAAGFETYNGPITLRNRSSFPSFVEAPTLIDLEEREALSVVVHVPADLPRSTTVSLEASCGEEPGVVIARLEDPDPGEHRVEVLPGAFMSPGRCHFVLSTAPGRAESVERWPFDVRSAVSITAVQEPSWFEAIDVLVHLRAHGSKVKGGLVEVRSEGDRNYLGNAEVVDGQAHLRLAAVTAPLDLTISYVSNSPQYLGGELLHFRQEPARSWTIVNIWGRALVLGALLLWLVRHWLRRNERAQPLANAPGEAGVLQLGDNVGPLHGLVKDAHTNEILPGILVRLCAISATQEETVDSCRTGQDGRFQFTHASSSASHLRLVIAEPGYAGLVADVSAGNVVVSLTQLRHAGLRSFAQWAKRKTSPWFGRPVPTPGHARDELSRTGPNSGAAWANEVERLVYGPVQPSEAEIKAIEAPPSDAGGELDIDGPDPRFL